MTGEIPSWPGRAPFRATSRQAEPRSSLMKRNGSEGRKRARNAGFLEPRVAHADEARRAEGNWLLCPAALPRGSARAEPSTVGPQALAGVREVGAASRGSPVALYCRH